MIFYVAALTILSSSILPLDYWTEIEGGPIFQSINDVQIPNTTGTRFSLADFSQGPWFSYRAYFGLTFSKQHSIRLLLAPLSVSATGYPEASINYQNKNFAANTLTEGNYMFNSYRLTYRYQFTTSSSWELSLGFTGKIRDAGISISQANTFAERTNVGFVPLLHIKAKYFLNYSWWLDVDIDALASQYGRAEDAALKVYFKPDSEVAFGAGYRTVEGGSNGKRGSTYGFAWFHYAVLSIKYDF